VPISRRTFLSHWALATGTAVLSGRALGGRAADTGPAGGLNPAPYFPVSLAQWSLHRSYFGSGLNADFVNRLHSDPDSLLRGELDPLDFPVLARQTFGIDAVEYVNTFYFSRARDEGYLRALKSRADGEGVSSRLIMCDALGNTGDEDAQSRHRAVQNHLPWLQAAALLGCHSIRVNAAGQGSREEVSRRVAESLNALGELAMPLGLSVLVENHGGYSSDGAWLAATIVRTDHPAVGTLPDFGNFRLSPRGATPVETYDRYIGTEELMPYARAVSAKSYDFDGAGNETTIDYGRMLRIAAAAGYSGHIGVEYEGRRLSEFDGIRATQRLIQKIGSEISAEREKIPPTQSQLPDKPS
jgi:sugar phosphate isomerase/epimerase